MTMVQSPFEELIVRMREITPLANEILEDKDALDDPALYDMAKSCLAIANCSLSTETDEPAENPTDLSDEWEEDDEDA